ncbi:MAG: NAD+ synthase [Bdellovibrionia bacterium]
MRIGIAQINPVLADFETNFKKIIDDIHRARDKKCELLVFPECALIGYHPFDLLEREDLVRKQMSYLKKIEKQVPSGMAIVLGLITLTGKKLGRPYYNSAALIQKNKKTQFFHKTLLPTGDVFDEARFIEPSKMDKNYFSYKGKRFFVTICEDIWAWPDKAGKSPYEVNPIKKVERKKTDLVINLSASPYFVGKMKLREQVALQTAKYFKAPILYANLVGAQDEIIFDGASFVLDPQGKKLLSCHSFEEDLNIFDLSSRESWAKAPHISEIDELHRALKRGLADFVTKLGIKRVHLGLSGGIDSALVAALAVDALGPNRVTLIAMPGPFSDQISLELAEQLAKNLGCEFLNVPITKMYEGVKETVDVAFAIKNFSTVHENLQARIRGMTLMAYANATGSLLLTTGNKSEYATGYSTLYGDMCGGLAPIGDLTKKQVYQLSNFYNSQSELIPHRIIDRAPSAELRPNQKDQDSLPEYDILDKSVVQLVENFSPAKSKAEKWLLPILMGTEFKRWQAPPILKVSKHAFGRGRRYPIAHSYRG